MYLYFVLLSELEHFGLLSQYYRPLGSWSALKDFHHNDHHCPRTCCRMLCVIGNGVLGVLVHAVVGVVRNNSGLVVFTNTIVRVVWGGGGLVPLELDADGV